MPAPLRLSDLAAHLTPLGFPEDPWLARSFLAEQVRSRGVRVGGFYLADKKGGREFTGEDEEVLAIFAAQAGAAISNARNYRDEHGARTKLEALINTSPVAMVMFDARSGQVVSLNREAHRIAEGLRRPGQSPEDLLRVLRVRRSRRSGGGAGPGLP